MTMKLKCADSGMKCDFEVTSETMNELMEHVNVHAKYAHPEMANKPPSPEQLKKIVTTV